MKIVYVLDTMTNRGGIERIISFKMNYLSEKGYDVYLITASQSDHTFSFDLSSKITFIDLNIRFHQVYKSLFSFYKRIQLNLLFKKRLTKKIYEIDPDIIISTTYFFSDIICKLKCKAKKIVESHCDLTILSSITTNDNKLKKLYKINKKKSLIKCIELKCDALVCLTKGEAENRNTSNKYVIEDSLTYYPIETSSLNNKKVLAVGSLIPVKGFDLLIKAYIGVFDKHRDWTLEIYGAGELQNSLNELISDSQLTNNCFLRPSSSNIYEHYLDSSIFSVSFISEGFSMVLLEAMSCGLACVSFDCPFGPSEIIHDNIDGILVEPNNIEKMTKAINYYIENESIRKEAGMKARANVDRFYPDIIMNKWNDLLQSLNCGNNIIQ